MSKKTGLAFHVHDKVLVEFCYSYSERIRDIKERKPKDEQETSLRLLKLIPKDRVPPVLDKIWEGYWEVLRAFVRADKAHGKAREAHFKAGKALSKVSEADYYKAAEAYFKATETYNKVRKSLDKAKGSLDKAWEVCVKAVEIYMPELIKLHEELCPSCPWDGETIFPKK